MQKVYSSQLWQLVKTWEITQAKGLESGRRWANTIPSLTAPAATKIPDGPNGMAGTAVANEYFTSVWYELQLLVNDGNHRHRDALPIDWPYFIDSVLKLHQQSSSPEPARLLIAVVKAMQSTDPRIGPGDVAQGWRPERNVDPRIMVDSEWSPIFQPLQPIQKRVITESLLTAWLDKNEQYRGVEYFQQGVSAQSFAHFYDVPKELRGVSGGQAWNAVAEFQATGVRPRLITRLVAWGDEYKSLAQRFHY